jgi:hypothetical protein
MIVALVIIRQKSCREECAMLPFLAAIRRVFSVCLPISAVLAVGISPGAQAQAPPGPLGWVPLPRPLVVNPQPGPDYDWTGFQNSLTLTPFNFVGPPAKQITTTYGGGAEGSTSGGNYMMEYPYAGTGGSGNTLAEANATINGAATYKWQWTPPNNAAGQPDIVKFPVPPLYTLADVYAMAWTRLPNGTSAVGLAVKMGNLSDGLPDNWTASMQSVPQQIGDTLPHRGVLPTTLDRVKPLTYDVALSPAGSLDVTGKQTVPQGGYNGPVKTSLCMMRPRRPAF